MSSWRATLWWVGATTQWNVQHCGPILSGTYPVNAIVYVTTHNDQCMGRNVIDRQWEYDGQHKVQTYGSMNIE